jgi:cysteine desulfurase
MRDRLQVLICQQFPTAVINSADANRTPQTLNLAFPGINRQSFLMSADLAGLAISTGSACASGSSDPSPVLIAMSLDSAVVDSSIRISFGYSNTDAEVDEAFKRIKTIVDRAESSA